MNATDKARRDALMARTSDAALIGALRIIESTPNRTPDERAARAWMIDEVERRFPDASAAVDAAFYAAGEDGDFDDVDYVGVLLANVPGQL